MIQPSFEELREWAFTDELTGLSNRRHLRLKLDELLTAQVPLVYLAIDLDGFKRAQDQHTHEWGDYVLRLFADFLRDNTRYRGDRLADGVLARVGGDEFLIAAPRSAQSRLERLVRAWTFEGVTATVGIGSIPRGADEALCAAKRARSTITRG